MAVKTRSAKDLLTLFEGRTPELQAALDDLDRKLQVITELDSVDALKAKADSAKTEAEAWRVKADDALAMATRDADVIRAEAQAELEQARQTAEGWREAAAQTAQALRSRELLVATRERTLGTRESICTAAQQEAVERERVARERTAQVERVLAGFRAVMDQESTGPRGPEAAAEPIPATKASKT